MKRMDEVKCGGGEEEEEEEEENRQDEMGFSLILPIFSLSWEFKPIVIQFFSLFFVISFIYRFVFGACMCVIFCLRVLVL